MPVRIGAGLSTLPDARAGAEEAAAAAVQGLGGAPCDVAVLFAAGMHLAAPEATLEAVHEALAPGVLVGCGAQGVLGCGREIEAGNGVAVWAAAIGGGMATPFHAIVEGGEERRVASVPDLEGAAGAIMLADPATFPAEPVLGALNSALPEVPVVGGVASARLPDGSAALFLEDELVASGAVGLRFDGVEMAPCVSQGAAPLGPELTITAAEGNVVLELAGKPAYAKLREVLEGLPPAESLKLQRAGGVLLGIVVDPNKPDYVQGDFLVRPLMGADPRTGALAVGALVRPGQVVRLHARDAESADRDLREALEIRSRDLGLPPATVADARCSGRPTTTPARSPRRWQARRPRASSPPARSARWPGRPTSTASPRRSRCSPAEAPAGARR